MEVFEELAATIALVQPFPSVMCNIPVLHTALFNRRVGEIGYHEVLVGYISVYMTTEYHLSKTTLPLMVRLAYNIACMQHKHRLTLAYALTDARAGRSAMVRTYEDVIIAGRRAMHAGAPTEHNALWRNRVSADLKETYLPLSEDACAFNAKHATIPSQWWT